MSSSVNSGQVLPSGTVTFLFTDIEGSTKLAQEFPGELPVFLAWKEGGESKKWYHRPMTTASAQSHPNIAFIK